MSTNNAINLSSQGVAYYNGSGTFTAPTLTQHGVVIGDASNNIKTVSVMTDGQLLIGSTGADPVPASLTAGTNITLTPGAGTLTIATTVSPLVWQTTSINVANMAVGTGYICISPGGGLTLGLPTTAAVGDTMRVALKGATSWQITQAAGQSIQIGNNATTIGAGGSLTSAAQGDCLEIVCVTANTGFIVVSAIGNITVV